LSMRIKNNVLRSLLREGRQWLPCRWVSSLSKVPK